MSEEKIETLGARLKQVRGKMTQKEFADLLGVGRTTVINYEKGERQPDPEFFVRMELIFNTEPGWLITGRGQEKKEGQLKRDEAWLLWKYRELTDEGKTALNTMLNALPKKEAK